MLRWTGAEREQEKERQRKMEEKVSLVVTLENKERLGIQEAFPKLPPPHFPETLPPLPHLR